MDKQNILEEINRMKSLFKYQKGKVISEQRRLLRENPTTNVPSIINEQDDFDDDPTPVTAAPATTTGTTATTPVTAAPATTTGTTATTTGTTANLTAQQMMNNLKQKATELAAQTKAKGTSMSSKPGTTPAELKDTEGIKKFQQWLDTNKAGWATGYKGGKVGNQKGFGLFGKRTSNAWNQYGQEYLKSTGAVSTAPGSVVTTNTNTVTTPPQTGGGEDWDD